MIVTIQIGGPHHLVQGNAGKPKCACGSSVSFCQQHQSGQCTCATDRATVLLDGKMWCGKLVGKARG